MPETSPLVVSFVGSGGKTSTMFQLARELEAMGKRVIVTTSTHIRRPEAGEGYQVVETDDPEEIKCVKWKRGILVVGQPAKENKLKGLPFERIGSLVSEADVLLIEADGAKCMPLKVPANHEPVLIPQTELVVGCAGLDSIGKPLLEVCFRAELAEALLGVDGNHRVTPEDMAVLLLHEEGTRKMVENLPYRIILNKADDPQKQEYGKSIVEIVKKWRPERVVLTSYYL